MKALFYRIFPEILAILRFCKLKIVKLRADGAKEIWNQRTHISLEHYDTFILLTSVIV